MIPSAERVEVSSILPGYVRASAWLIDIVFLVLE